MKWIMIAILAPAVAALILAAVGVYLLRQLDKAE